MKNLQHEMEIHIEEKQIIRKQQEEQEKRMKSMNEELEQVQKEYSTKEMECENQTEKIKDLIKQLSVLDKENRELQELTNTQYTPNENNYNQQTLIQQDNLQHDVVSLTPANNHNNTSGSTINDSESKQPNNETDISVPQREICNYVPLSNFIELENRVKKLEENIQGMQESPSGVILSPHSPSPPPPPPKSTNENNITKSKEITPAKKDVIIAGDGHARNLKDNLRKQLPTNWTIDEHYDVKAKMRQTCGKFLKEGNECNHLIIFTGSNDIFNSAKREVLENIKKIIDSGKVTKKIHLVLIPDRYDDPKINLHINNLNEQIMEFVTPYKNVQVYNPRSIIDSWDYTSDLVNIDMVWLSLTHPQALNWRNKKNI
ncbi:hypothetical protein M8J76_016903 [Diaphorina citri]|nr:hypothetical protein M8J76_016903 [Diaphorina citri]